MSVPYLIIHKHINCYLFKLFSGVPLFDYSSTQMVKKNKRLLNYYLSQMLCVKYFLEDLQKMYSYNINGTFEYEIKIK